MPCAPQTRVQAIRGCGAIGRGSPIAQPRSPGRSAPWLPPSHPSVPAPLVPIGRAMPVCGSDLWARRREPVDDLEVRQLEQDLRGCEDLPVTPAAAKDDFPTP